MRWYAFSSQLRSSAVICSLPIQIARFELKLALLASGRLVEASALNVIHSELVGMLWGGLCNTQG
jgi:hypothetical protein